MKRPQPMMGLGVRLGPSGSTDRGTVGNVRPKHQPQHLHSRFWCPNSRKRASDQRSRLIMLMSTAQLLARPVL
jgi:hypothetical protein